MTVMSSVQIRNKLEKSKLESKPAPYVLPGWGSLVPRPLLSVHESMGERSHRADGLIQPGQGYLRVNE